MAIKVSVVVPVYNPGRYIERSIESLLAQSLPAEELELLFMDDGSDDGTERRLDELAAAHPHVHVGHFPNSGWPGKPRNTGIERATGEYVMFVDCDDRVGVEGLERMYDLGSRNGADVVFGKVTSDFRGVPQHVFRRTVERCDASTHPLFDSLTPHKMFRRQFLLDEGIRFPEGKRRLEDQQMLAHAYLAAKTASVVGDYVCYQYCKRDDGGNISSQRIDVPKYFVNLRQVLDVVLENSEPGELQDSVIRRFYRNEMLRALGGNIILKASPERREEQAREVQKLALERRYFRPQVHSGMLAALRVRSYHAQRRDIPGLIDLAERYNAVGVQARLEGAQWRDGVLVVQVRAWQHLHREQLELESRDGRLLLPTQMTGDAPAQERDATGQLDLARVEVVVKDRQSPLEWSLPVRFTRSEQLDGDRVRVEWAGEVEFDPVTGAVGRPLDLTIWDLSVRVAALGLTRETRLGRERTAAAEQGVCGQLVADGTLLVRPYWTDPYGNLSVALGPTGGTLPAGLRPDRSAVRLRRQGRTRRITVRLPIGAPTAGPVRAGLRLVERRSGEVVELAPVSGTRDAGSTTITAVLPPRSRPGRAGLAAGSWDLAVVVPGISDVEMVRTTLVLQVPQRGPLQVVPAAEAKAKAGALPLRPAVTAPAVVREMRRRARNVVRAARGL